MSKMTTPELAALVELLNRCPMTAAERLWCQALIERLAKSQSSGGESGLVEDVPVG